MSTIFRRLCAALLSLALLFPCVSQASELEAFSCRLNFKIDASAYPEADRTLITGIADLLNITQLQIVHATDGTGFDTFLDVYLGDQPESDANMHIFGTAANWWFKSPLLGNECVRMNNSVLLEFAMKAYAHLSMPLQYVALLVCPYVHTSAFEWILPAWQETFAGDTTRTVTRDDVMALAQFISDNGEDDRAFYYWVHALTRDIGIDADVLDGLYFLPDWVGTFLAEDGLHIAIDGDTERWTTGDITLFEHTAGADTSSWQLTLPANDYGQVLVCSYRSGSNSEELTLTITEADAGDVLSARFCANSLPSQVDSGFIANVSLTAHGRLLPRPIDLCFTAETTDDAFSVTQLDATTAAPMLTVSGKFSPVDAPASLTYDEGFPKGDISILTVNEAALSGFMGRIIKPLAQGGWPLLLQMPASSIASMYSLLEQYGVLDLLLFGLGS